MINQIVQAQLHASAYDENPFPAPTYHNIFFGSFPSGATFSAQTFLTSCSFFPGHAPAQGGGVVEAYILRYGGFFGPSTWLPSGTTQITNIPNGHYVQFGLTVLPATGQQYGGIRNLATGDSVATVFVQS
jgi:hypothetical protein